MTGSLGAEILMYFPVMEETISVTMPLYGFSPKLKCFTLSAVKYNIFGLKACFKND